MSSNQIEKNSILCHQYYQGLLNQIQNFIFIQKQDKSILFQDIYTLATTIDHYYCKCNCKCYYTRQAEKKALESHFQKQDKTSSAGNTTAFQNKENTFLMASFTKSSSSNMLSPTLKKQSNSLWMDLFSKLANNSKLASDECKKHLENDLCLYYGVEDHKLDFYSKKQTIVTFKGYST